MKLKIGTKISLGFALVVILMIAIGGYALVGFNQINEINDHVLGTVMPGVNVSKDLQIAVVEKVVALRGFLLTEEQSFLDDYEKFNTEEKAAIEDNYNYVHTDMDRELNDNLKRISEEYNNIAKEVISLKQQGRDTTALENQGRPLVQEIRNIAQELIELNDERLLESRLELEEIQNRVRLLIYIIVGLAIVLSVFIAITTARSIIGPINQFTYIAERVAEGNLTEEVDIKTQDEISLLAEAFNTMIYSLRDIIGQINEVSQGVAATSQQLSASSEESAAAAEDISNVVEEVASATNDEAAAIAESNGLIREMHQGTGEMMSNIRDVGDAARVSLGSAKGGLESAEAAVERINNIKTTTIETSKTILRLNEDSKQIESIVDVINAISEQTNLLALNAAIEAARAGESGRGFAVVADEIRKLAEESSESTQQIAELISAVQNQIESAVNSMEVSDREVDLGVEIISSASGEFSNIFSEINGVSSEIDRIVAIVEGISEGTNTITENFEHMSALSEETAASAEEVSASSEEQTAAMEEVATSAAELASMADELANSIAVFRY